MSTETAFETAGPLLSVGIVVFRSDLALLGRCLDSLERAASALPARAGTAAPACEVHVVDNGPPDYSTALAAFLAGRRDAGAASPILHTGHGNLGYGRGNNLVIARSRARYHLVLNPDTELEAAALARGVGWLERRPDVGLVAATSIGPDGLALNLCKVYPTVAILASRLLPRSLCRGPLAALRASYDLAPSPDGVTDVTGSMVSGSFMLCRTAALHALGGFDPRYFLYFEDFDLARRMAHIARVVWLSDVRLLHHGGDAARKGWAHRRMFVRGAFRFFSTHGWRFW
jgi:GT2 family glycosyltransferase